jgi:error-prone DNA polymerase
MARNGLVAAEADHLYAQIQAFSNFGFAESHSLSFALLVYASSWMKLHYPAAFLAGLLRAQPMGFYSASTLVSDARRHGVVVLRPDLARSDVDAGLESTAGTVPEEAREERTSRTEGPTEPAQPGPTGFAACANRHQPKVGDFDISAPDVSEAHRRDAHFAVRLGLSGVRGIGRGLAATIVAERQAGGAYRSMEDLVRRTGLKAEDLEALAAAGALESLGLTRRQALWRAGSAALDQPGSLPGTLVESQPLLFDDPTPVEVLADDLWATGVSTEDHPIAQLRAELDARGVLSTARLATAEPDRRVEVGGLVTHRQRPGTASGITFVSLEDEFGLVNVVCSVGVWQHFRKVARSSPALIVRGKLERSPEGVVNVVADHLEPLPIMVVHRSRDFH